MYLNGCRERSLPSTEAGWEAAAIMSEKATIVTITYFGGEKVMPGYNLMGVCKAALEHSVRYLAWDLGRLKKIRVNALSAGPVRTLSSAGIADFDQMQDHCARKSPLGRNVLPEHDDPRVIPHLADDGLAYRLPHA